MTENLMKNLVMDTNGGYLRAMSMSLQESGYSVNGFYCNPTKKIIVVKTGADSGFEEDDKEKKSVAFFREVAATYGE